MTFSSADFTLPRYCSIATRERVTSRGGSAPLVRRRWLRSTSRPSVSRLSRASRSFAFASRMSIAASVTSSFKRRIVSASCASATSRADDATAVRSSRLCARSNGTSTRTAYSVGPAPLTSSKPVPSQSR